MGEGKQPPRSYSIHEAIARERALSDASGSLSAIPNDEDIFSDEDDSPLGLHCLPTLSRRVSRHVLPPITGNLPILLQLSVYQLRQARAEVSVNTQYSLQK